MLPDESNDTIKINCMSIKPLRQILLTIILLITNSCIVQYYPTINVDDELLVVEGLITDQPRTNTIKLSKTFPLWRNRNPRPLKGCKVWISDNFEHTDSLHEAQMGSYITDSLTFQGVAGRIYTLHITTSDSVNLSYESFPMEMKSVPPIDSIYYEKIEYITASRPVVGCQIFLNTHDATNKCKFFRWEYSETWEFHLPSIVTHRICWLSGKSNGIFIKNTLTLNENSVTRYPIKTISDPNDRLSVKYSLLVNQFSLDENEYNYWERFKNTVEQVGGLYDIIPSSIPNNLFCVEYPYKKVLGYFSVSATSSKRIFIKDNFDYVYANCVADTIFGKGEIPGLNVSVFIIKDNSDSVPPFRIVTYKLSCTDCRERGTEVKPVFWEDDKK